MRRHLWWAIGLGLVGLGIALQATAPHDFGWFAYAGSGPVHFSGVMMLTHQEAIGVGVALVGLVVLASWFGYALGRRKGARDQGSETN